MASKDLSEFTNDQLIDELQSRSGTMIMFFDNDDKTTEVISGSTIRLMTASLMMTRSLINRIEEKASED